MIFVFKYKWCRYRVETVQEVLIIKEICKKCGNEIDETEYMQFITSSYKKDEKSEIENFTVQKVCVDCFTKIKIQKNIKTVVVKAV